MKTSIPYLLISFFLFASLAACSEHLGPTPEEIEAAWNQTPGKISLEQGVQMQNDYIEYLYNDSLMTTDGTTYADYREVWFDLEDLKNYIHYVEQYGRDKNYANLGMRVYFGAKNVESGMPRSTVFFYGTGRFAGTENLIQDDEVITEPNLPGADGLNMGNSGMPPVTLNK